MKDVQWATQTCILGWPVGGVFDPSMDGTDINCVDRSPDGKLLAAGDDFFQVNLYRYPVVNPGNQAVRLRCHASFVCKVKFSADGQYLFSAGGGDETCMQW